MRIAVASYRMAGSLCRQLWAICTLMTSLGKARCAEVLVTASAAATDTEQHNNSLVSRRDWQELESGRSMEEQALTAAAPPAPAAVRARGELQQQI